MRAYAAEGYEPADVVGRVNHLMWHLGPLAMTTLAYLVLDPATESLQIVNAGHPPPLIAEPGAAPRFLDAPRGVALGATSTAVYEAGTAALPTGSTVLLYTDGLVERRTEPIDAGLERLRALAAGGARTTSSGCARRSSAGSSRTPRPTTSRASPSVSRRSPTSSARPGRRRRTSLAGVRYLLGRWLRGRGATRDEIYDITVAAQEACTNAIEHAYSPGPAGFERHRRLRGRPRADRRPRPRALARAARLQPRARAAHDAGADGHSRRAEHGGGN